MTWLVGIDEAGYGPNLGPFVMSTVVCHVPDGAADTDLWTVLAEAVRRGEGRDDRLIVDDSKVVHTGRGLPGLERTVLATLAAEEAPDTLSSFLERFCLHGHDDLRAEAWYTGTTPLPAGCDAEEAPACRERFARACEEGGVGGWRAGSVVVCPRAFNRLLDRHESKGAVLSDAMAHLLRSLPELAPGEGPVHVFIDKHGGRNHYAAQLQDALAEGFVLVVQEGMALSRYRVLGLSRELTLTFQPRADGERFPVALASMLSKYLRELLMAEFNAFWAARVEGLKPTAGYPNDATRFLAAIRPVAEKLGLDDTGLWRRK